MEWRDGEVERWKGEMERWRDGRDFGGAGIFYKKEVGTKRTPASQMRFCIFLYIGGLVRVLVAGKSCTKADFLDS